MARRLVTVAERNVEAAMPRVTFPRKWPKTAKSRASRRRLIAERAPIVRAARAKFDVHWRRSHGGC